MFLDAFPSFPRRKLFSIGLLLCVLLVPSSGYADQPASAQASKAIEPALPELPKPPPRSPRTPSPTELEALDKLLTELRSADADARARARAALVRIDESWVPAIAERLRRVSEAVDKPAMKEALQALKRKLKDETPDRGQRKEPLERDYLEQLLEHPAPENDNWKHLVTVLGMSRMLAGVGTVEAVRELIGIYVRFGEFLRIDTQLQLEKLGDRSIAGLIEATQHPAPKIAAWAEKRLDLMGKSEPTEVVQVDAPPILADVLRAYGSTRDPEFARLIISFTNSEHAEIRRAARQATSLLGEVANWPIRDTYEKLTGKRAFREWSWDRCARELFREFDRARLANVYLAYQAGVTKREAEELDEMRKHFDEVLTQDPGFENANEMAAGYFEYAKAKAKDSPDDALSALERAERLADDAALRSKIESARLTVEGTRLLARGIADQILFRRALLLDPENQNAKENLANLESTASEAPSGISRHAVTFVIVLLTLIGAIFLLKPARQSPPGGQGSTSANDRAGP